MTGFFSASANFSVLSLVCLFLGCFIYVLHLCAEVAHGFHCVEQAVETYSFHHR